MSAEPETRIPSLDGLRGIAILLVLVMHFTLYGGPPPSSPADAAFYQTAAAGWIGVDLFFVLSGFLITGILWDARGSEGYFRGFYARRCLRIFPLYYAALLIFLVLLPALLSEHSGLRAAKQDAAWYWTYLSNVQIAREGWPAFGALGHFWSLAVEEQFYLVWPAVVFLLGRRALMAACLGCIALCPLLRLGLHLAGHATAAYTLTPARMDALAVGALLALAARGPHGLSRLSRRAGPAAAALGLGLAALCAWKSGLPSEDPAVSVLGGSLLAGLFGALLVLAVTSQAWSGALSLSGLVVFGRYSYALYVLHHPLLFLKPEGLSASALPRLWGSQLPGRLLFIAAATGVCLGLAWLSWHLLERRFLELKNRFPYQTGEVAPGAEGVPAP
ncbi:MAG TPA: acyltransferase [Thermoanaerobaculia bacterium]